MVTVFLILINESIWWTINRSVPGEKIEACLKTFKFVENGNEGDFEAELVPITNC